MELITADGNIIGERTYADERFFRSLNIDGLAPKTAAGHDDRTSSAAGADGMDVYRTVTVHGPAGDLQLISSGFLTLFP